MKEESYEPDNRHMRFLTVDEESGWISRTTDIRSNTYRQSAIDVLAEIRRRLADDFGATLVIANAPQRGIFVPFLDEVEKEDARAIYREMLGQLNSAGIITPDADEILTSDIAQGDSFYFPRDTHWTPEGAGVVARSLAKALQNAGKIDVSDDEPRYIFGDFELETFKGTFNNSIEEICGIEPPEHEMMVPNVVPVAHSTEELADQLFGDPALGDSKKIVLLGTSFGNSSGGDRFRWAAQLEHALQNKVENLSLTGGLTVTAFEAYAYRDLAPGSADIVIWEFPAVYVSNWIEYDFRQILGAIAGECSAETESHALSFEAGSDAEIRFEKPLPLQETVSLDFTDFEIGSMQLLLQDENGKKYTQRIRRRDRFPGNARTTIWRTSTHGLSGELIGIRIENLDSDLEGELKICD
ncbi:alginate O-acetyltransferase AlgX-related protein [Cognatishimia maritima]|uniref:alginate O-acetyltransferase AlgX-related protein n=1 Tax=Cognatishimia maritima TaxID=870908 RepID=UPI0013F4FB60|nr:hypothetical protein [Cognatishimia maritima]